jgi:hypothetical protein
MRKHLFIFAVVLILFTGCASQKNYTLVQSDESVAKISIIRVPNNSVVMNGDFSQFSTLTVIDKSKWGSILDELSNLPCGTYWNAPADYISGTVLMITYQNTDIELIGPDSAYYYNFAHEIGHYSNYRPFYFDAELFYKMLDRYSDQ